MTVKELIKRLKKLPSEKEVIFWNGEDNYGIGSVEEDAINDIEVVLTSADIIKKL